MNPPPPSLPSYPTIAYIEVSIDLPSPLTSYTTSASSEASMKTSFPPPSLPSYITLPYSEASLNSPSPSLFFYTTSAYNKASKNSPSSPSLLNLSLQWSQQEPAVLPLPTQTQPTVKPARTRGPPPPYSTSAYSEASKNPPSSPSLLNVSLQ